jgi:sodium/hydrogen antiporter
LRSGYDVPARCGQFAVSGDTPLGRPGNAVTWADLAVVAALVLLWTVVSGRAERVGITAPMVFVVGGLAFGGDQAFHITVSAATIRVTAEITLVLILFSDAARLRMTSLRRDVGLPGRLLGIGLPVTVAFGAMFAHLLFGTLSTWLAILAAACLAPTDAGLGAGIVTSTSVPSRIRRALNVESGLNDGIVAPLVSLAVAVLIGEASNSHGPLIHAIREIGVGVLVGAGAGLATGWILALSTRKGWTESGTVALATPAAAIGTYSLAVALHGNGFVAAFLAGLCFGIFKHHLEPRSLELSEGSSQLLACVVWFAFGAAMLRPSLSSPDLLRCLVYAVVSLTVVRMVPVGLALYRTHLGAATVAFIGWFGPRGLASVIFALLAFDELGREASVVLTVVSITVALSILLHGLSANPLIARYSAHALLQESGHPLHRPSEVPAARRTFGSIGPPAKRRAA